MFKNPLHMHEQCAACGHRFDPGGGYFLGAMYFSYTIVVVVAAVFVIVLRIAGLQWSHTLWAALAIAPLVGPFVAFPYSRALWVMVERRFLRDGVADDPLLRDELRRRQRAMMRDARGGDGQQEM